MVLALQILLYQEELKAFFKRGNDFNEKARGLYEYNEVTLKMGNDWILINLDKKLYHVKQLHLQILNQKRLKVTYKK